VSPFAPIRARALARTGGEAAIEAVLVAPSTAAELRARSDDRYLSQMSLHIFRAGLRHEMVDQRWPAFEEAFVGFDPRRVVRLDDEALERLMSDARLIRHWGKIKSVRANAAAVLEVAQAHGSFGNYLAGWPDTATVELWADLARRFSQMGGQSGPYFLRMVGKDTFLLTANVLQGLHAAGVLSGPPSAKPNRKALAAIQSAFNAGAEETRRPL